MKNGIIAFLVVVCLVSVVYALSLNEDVYMNGYNLYDVGRITGEEGLVIDSSTVIQNNLEVEQQTVFGQQTFYGGDLVPIGYGVINLGSEDNAFKKFYAEQNMVLMQNSTWCQLYVNGQGVVRCIG